MKLRVTILASHYLPAFKAGGPVRSLSALVDGLGDEIDFRVITRDRDVGDAQPFDNVSSDDWQPAGRASVAYLSPARAVAFNVARLIRLSSPDVLYLNSFFDPFSFAAPLMLLRSGLIESVPLVVAPRGQFGRGALAIKTWKKRTYLAAARSLGLTRRILWHATSASESDDIRRVVGRQCRIVVAPNVCRFDSGHPSLRPPKQSGLLKLVFFSRVSPKKNLHGALEMLGSVRGRVTFDIWGPLEDKAYWDQCQTRIQQLPASVAVNYCGPINPDCVAGTLAQYDALLLPTLNENFGHAIIESLAAGCPVVISDQTPWRDLRRRGIGWDIPLADAPRFQRALTELVEMDEAAHRPLRDRAAAFAREVAAAPAHLEKHRQLFAAAGALTRPHPLEHVIDRLQICG